MSQADFLSDIRPIRTVCKYLSPSRCGRKVVVGGGCEKHRLLCASNTLFTCSEAEFFRVFHCGNLSRILTRTLVRVIVCSFERGRRAC